MVLIPFFFAYCDLLTFPPFVISTAAVGGGGVVHGHLRGCRGGGRGGGRARTAGAQGFRARDEQVCYVLSFIAARQCASHCRRTLLRYKARMVTKEVEKVLPLLAHDQDLRHKAVRIF